MKTKKIVFLILILIWMVTVFCFSNQASEDSSKTSGDLIRAILNIIPGFDKMQEEQYVEMLQPIARKLAHFSVYCIGGALIILYINEYNLQDIKKLICSTLIGCCYSITDEIHQTFVPRKSRNVNRCNNRHIRRSSRSCICLFYYKIYK